MRPRARLEALPDELTLAIGLVWGHLNVYQFEQAYQLAAGCLQVWSGEKHLRLMAAYAASELLLPVDRRQLLQLQDAACADWIALILRRLEIAGESAATVEHFV